MADGSERPLPTLDLSGPASQSAERWRKWKRAYQYYSDGKGITNPKRQTAQLLHLAGLQLHDIYEELPNPDPVADNEDEYKVCIRKLDKYFHVKNNVPYERHVFRQLSLKNNETVDQFITRLRQQAHLCDFGTSLNDNLRDQLIDKIRNTGFRKKLLQTNNINLEEALSQARAWEAVDQQLRQMTLVNEDEQRVNSVTPPRQQRKSRADMTCFNCGRKGHIARDHDCPARGKICAKCNKHGHFAPCCRGGNSVPQ